MQVITREDFDKMIRASVDKMSNQVQLRDRFAMNAPITFSDAVIQCGYKHLDLTDTERGVVMSVLAMMRYEYADAMIKQREVMK